MIPPSLPRTPIHALMHTLNDLIHSLSSSFSKIYCLLCASHCTRFQGCTSQTDFIYINIFIYNVYTLYITFIYNVYINIYYIWVYELDI